MDRVGSTEPRRTYIRGCRVTTSRMPQAAFSPESAAEVYDTSRDTIIRAIKSGKLAARKIGPKYSITAQALEVWHNNLPEA